MKTINLHPVLYRDGYFRLTAAFVAACIASWYGGDESFFTLLLTPSFYSEFVTSLLFSFLIIEWISRVTIYLDKRYDWKRNTVGRLPLQVLWGIVVPGIMEFILAAAYFRLFGVDILDTNFLAYAFPFLVSLILLFNVYYLAYYFLLRWKQAEMMAVGSQQSPESTDQALNMEIEQAEQPKEIFWVSSGAKRIALPYDDICYFYRKDDAY